jgi:hypothetical protein
MPGLEIDLNQNPSESDLENPIDWDEIEEWDGPANELNYAMVWNDENQGEYLIMILDLLCLPSVHDLNFFDSVFHILGDGQGSDGEQDDAPADGEQDDAPADGVQVEGFSNGDFQFPVLIIPLDQLPLFLR